MPPPLLRLRVEECVCLCVSGGGGAGVVVVADTGGVGTKSEQLICYGKALDTRAVRSRGHRPPPLRFAPVEVPPPHANALFFLAVAHPRRFKRCQSL